MNKMVSRVLWMIAGALLIVAGMMCLMHPGVALSSASLFLGIAMMFSGIVDIIIFATGHAWMFGAGWFLVDGILTVLLSLFIFGNQWFTTLTLPFIMGMWLLFSGISKFVNSFDLQRLGVHIVETTSFLSSGSKCQKSRKHCAAMLSGFLFSF